MAFRDEKPAPESVDSLIEKNLADFTNKPDLFETFQKIEQEVKGERREVKVLKQFGLMLQAVKDTLTPEEQNELFSNRKISDGIGTFERIKAAPAQAAPSDQTPPRGPSPTPRQSGGST